MLRDFFERTMRAASGPLLWSDVITAEMESEREERAETSLQGRRSARTGKTRKDTQKGGNASRGKRVA